MNINIIILILFSFLCIQMDSMRKGKEPLLADLLFAMAGVDCKAVRVRQSSGQEMGTFVNSSVPKNSIQIVRELLVIIAGIKK